MIASSAVKRCRSTSTEAGKPKGYANSGPSFSCGCACGRVQDNQALRHVTSWPDASGSGTWPRFIPLQAAFLNRDDEAYVGPSFSFCAMFIRYVHRLAARIASDRPDSLLSGRHHLLIHIGPVCRSIGLNTHIARLRAASDSQLDRLLHASCTPFERVVESVAHLTVKLPGLLHALFGEGPLVVRLSRCCDPGVAEAKHNDRAGSEG